MLAVGFVVLWTAIPASACLFAHRSAGLPSCCRAMMRGSDCGATGIGGSCCQVQQPDTSTVPISPYTLGTAQRMALELSQSDFPTASTSGIEQRTPFEIPPPNPPPGGSPILRI